MENDMIREKIEFFLTNKITVHLEQENGQFYNGLILECSDKHLIILDRYVGKAFVYYSNITKLEPYKERK